MTTAVPPLWSPQTCPDTLTRKWSSTGFNGSFLATIPVLQWAKDVNLQQYQRLKQYGGTYGWASMDYESKKCVCVCACACAFARARVVNIPSCLKKLLNT